MVRDPLEESLEWFGLVTIVNQGEGFVLASIGTVLDIFYYLPGGGGGLKNRTKC